MWCNCTSVLPWTIALVSNISLAVNENQTAYWEVTFRRMFLLLWHRTFGTRGTSFTRQTLSHSSYAAQFDITVQHPHTLPTSEDESLLNNKDVKVSDVFYFIWMYWQFTGFRTRPPLPRVMIWRPDMTSLHFLLIVSAGDECNTRFISREHAQWGTRSGYEIAVSLRSVQAAANQTWLPIF